MGRDEETVSVEVPVRHEAAVRSYLHDLVKGQRTERRIGPSVVDTFRPEPVVAPKRTERRITPESR